MWKQDVCLCVVTVLSWCLASTSGKRWKHGDIRLIGGGKRYLGTVLYNNKGKWGAICDDQWDLKDATVACRQLGFTSASEAPKGSRFGIGRRRMWLSKTNCNGNEASISKCAFRGPDRYTRYRCPGRKRAAGIICHPNRVTITTPTTTKKTTTTTTTTTTTLPTTLLKDTTSTKKPSNLGLNHRTSEGRGRAGADLLLDVVKSDMPASGLEAFPEAMNMLAPHDINLVQSEDEIIKQSDEHRDKIEEKKPQGPSDNGTKKIKTVDEETIKDGDVTETGKEKINQNADNSTVESAYNKKEEENLLADSPQTHNVEVKLEGGRYKWEGHLLIRVNGEEWGTICSDHWTMKEAIVACHQLPDIGKAKQALLSSYFGGQNETKTVYRIQCSGKETNMSDCLLTRMREGLSCAKKTNVAGVTCSKHLPDLVPNIRALQDSLRLQDQPLYYLRCSMEENCLSSSAYTIKNTSRLWRNNMRRLLRFSTIVYNRGTADFRPYLPRGQWEWHECHMHYHSMEVFAHYDIMHDNGTRLAEGSKASFCLEDTTCDRGINPKYDCQGFGEQGLSVNCSDNYMYDIDCQWIDISDIKPGDYTFMMEINPSLLVAESDYENNVISCRLHYNGYFASVKNCHYENLLDYRRPTKA